MNLMDCVARLLPNAKMYQASSSELFGNQVDNIGMHKKPEQSIRTRFSPQSPYAIAKLAAHQYAGLLRKTKGLKISCGILFNHTSERRGSHFVLKKICNYVAELKKHQESVLENHWPKVNHSVTKLIMGNLDASRDIGYAPDYVEAMHMMLQQED